ncbi:F-box/kelch-repeat protein OR23 [Mercurialis annua]|uniref:F-box/kelch-repeat protein OR23 n=1 Tax=Mercurialis annua TaxID=3986 RepID=UPI00215F0750|nr:F-box/kelch-repeat protein OR23 [Mercurialis annua]
MVRFPSSSSSSSSSPLTAIDESSTLIQGLPNDVAAKILSMVPYSHQSRIKQISKSWYAFLSSKTLISTNLNHLLVIFPEDPSISSPYLFDPDNLAWKPLPPMPCNPHVYGLCNFTSISLGPTLYVLGGSLFDTRSYPMDRPTPSSAVFRYDFVSSKWDQLSPMLSPRGSFACAANANTREIIVAGGGSRHTMYGAAGSRMSSVEKYDVARDEWVAMTRLPRYRAGCVGFLVGNGEGGEGEEEEFWVMGGYGESRTIAGVCPVDEYYKDAVVMNVKKNGGIGSKWREVGDMWRDGERHRLGKIVVVQDFDFRRRRPGVFMLDHNEIFRYDMAFNSWKKESSVPRKASCNSSCGFIALDRELHVMTLLRGCESTDTRRSRQQKRARTLFIQIYHTRKKTWRSLITKAPFLCSLDFSTAVMCTIRL